MRLENLLVLELKDLECHNLPQINNILKKGKLPNLSELFVSHLFKLGRKQIKLDTFLREFGPNHCVKLEKFALQHFIISAEELEILSKILAVRLTKLDLTWSRGLTGNLSVLFTHIFPTLNTLILARCELNANDVQSLARANVEGKLPQLRHLDISENEDVIISDLFTHSQWNQLTVLETSDVNILNTEPECLTSLEELILHTPEFKVIKVPSVTRRWPRLKVIQVRKEDIVRCIADGVEQEMFPSLTTVTCNLFCYDKPFFFKLLKANISVERK